MFGQWEWERLSLSVHIVHACAFQAFFQSSIYRMYVAVNTSLLLGNRIWERKKKNCLTISLTSELFGISILLDNRILKKNKKRKKKLSLSLACKLFGSLPGLRRDWIPLVTLFSVNLKWYPSWRNTAYHKHGHAMQSVLASNLWSSYLSLFSAKIFVIVRYIIFSLIIVLGLHLTRHCSHACEQTCMYICAPIVCAPCINTTKQRTKHLL